MTFTVALTLRETGVPGQGEQLDNDRGKAAPLEGCLRLVSGQDSG